MLFFDSMIFVIIIITIIRNVNNANRSPTQLCFGAEDYDERARLRSLPRFLSLFSYVNSII